MELLSLQQTCLLFLIVFLDEFPPESLHLLPNRLRQELLHALPPCDIWRLEETAFVDGLHMNRVWRQVYEKCGLGQVASALCGCRRGTIGSSAASNRQKYPCICQLPQTTLHKQSALGIVHQPSALDNTSDGVKPARKCEYTGNQPEYEWRKCFINIVCSLILSSIRVPLHFSRERGHSGSKHYSSRGRPLPLSPFDVALQLLLTGHTQLPQAHSSRHDLSSLSILYCRCNVRPKRMIAFLHGFESSLKEATHLQKLIHILVSEFSIFPQTLCISHAKTSNSEVYQQLWRENSANDTLNLFLSKVVSLKLCYREIIPELSNGFCITECITSLPESCLESLAIVIAEHATHANGRSHMCKNLLSSLVPLFSPTLLEQEGCSFDINRESGGFSGLRNLHVSTNYSVESSKFNNAVATRELMRIAANQKQLESLSVSGWWGYLQKIHSTSMGILEKFCNCVFGSHLTLVHLKDLDIPVSLVQTFMKLFLQYPAVHEQTFVLQSVWMHEANTGSELDSLTAMNSATMSEERAATKSLHFLSMHIPNPFLSWLSTLPRLVLKDLELSDIQYDLDMTPGGLIGVFGNHNHSGVDNLSVSCHTRDCPEESIDLMFDTLQSLTLVQPKPNLLRNLVQGLRGVNKTYLRYLAIKDASLNSGNERLCKEFIDALFGLPQLSEMILDLRGTKMSEGHKHLCLNLPCKVIIN